LGPAPAPELFAEADDAERHTDIFQRMVNANCDMYKKFLAGIRTRELAAARSATAADRRKLADRSATQSRTKLRTTIESVENAITASAGTIDKLLAELAAIAVTLGESRAALIAAEREAAAAAAAADEERAADTDRSGIEVDLTHEIKRTIAAAIADIAPH
jgi:septal ring factor EnvC (AmiA/AmiB activator)